MEDGSGFLQTLLQEAASEGLHDEIDQDTSERQLQSMIENYQHQVLTQKRSPQHSEIKSNGNFDAPTKLRIQKSARNNVLSTISHSQPCLFVNEPKPESTQSPAFYLHHQNSSDSRDNYVRSVQNGGSQDDIDELKMRNNILRQKVEVLQKNTIVLQKLEVAYEKIEREFSQVVVKREKQDSLEHRIQQEMEQCMQKLASENELLKKQLEKLNLVAAKYQQLEPEHTLQYNMLMTELLPQNKELLASKDRLQIEIDAQAATLTSQRNHIEMLEKALANTQDRLAAKDRSAMDAVALVDKCNHQQKQLQEKLDENHRLKEEINRQRSSFETEIAQLKRRQHSKDDDHFGIKHADDLKRLLDLRDERIKQLESNLLETQKRSEEEMKKLQNAAKTEKESLLNKVQCLEKEGFLKEKKIQLLLDEKQRIHSQWADERRQLDNRVRLLEQNLRTQPNLQNVRSNGRCQSTDYSSNYPVKGSADMDVLKISTINLRSNYTSSNYGEQSNLNRLSNAAPQSTSNDHQVAPIVSLVNPIGNHGSGASSSADSTTNSSDSALASPGSCHVLISSASPNDTSAKSPNATNRMATKMPANYVPNYIDNLPANTRRRFINTSDNRVPKRTAIALGTSGFRRHAWGSANDKNSDNEEVKEPQRRQYSMDSVEIPQKTVVEVNRTPKNTEQQSAIHPIKTFD